MRAPSRIALLLVLTWPQVAFGFGLDEYRVKLGTRYDTIALGQQTRRIQGEVRTDFALDTVWEIKLKTAIATGDKYTSRYTTIWDFVDDESADFRLYPRNLYLERTISSFRFQLGTIPAVKDVVSSTGLRDLGWVDGGRAEYRYGSGVIEVVAGMISELDNPNTFTRDKGLNFFEVELSQNIDEHLSFELSSEHLDGQSYARGELRWNVPVGRNRGFELVGEGLFNYTTPSLAASATVDLDPIHVATGAYEDRLRLITYYSYVSPDIGTRGELTEDFFTTGHIVTIEAKGLLVESVGLSWFTKSIIAQTPRFQLGVSLKTRGP